jgi:uncharacterized protein (TIGR03000 family)
MYSIVMLTAMSASADVTPAPAPVAVAPSYGCTGYTSCTGCTGYYASCSGCYGSCHGSCYGSCHGSIYKRGGFLGSHKSCHGCSGYSCSGYNCFTSGYSCSGYSCSGCYGYAGACHGCYGISYGSSWGPPVGMLPYTLHGYNDGNYPKYGPSFPVVGSNLTNPYAVWGRTTNPNLPPVVVVPVETPKKAGSDDKPAGANLKFSVPADAKLYVDGKLAPGAGAERAFYTPALEPGKKFFYDVKAELVVAGQTVVDEKRVIVEAGQTVVESFPKLVAAVEKATSVAGK